MELPLSTTFLFVCTMHDETLVGSTTPSARYRPSMKHPTTDNSRVWVFDLEHMRCPVWNEGVENPSNGLVAECRPTWEAMIQARPAADHLHTKDVGYIAAGLRMYGDTLAETVTDPALSPEERVSFQQDLEEVENLLKSFE